MHLLDWLVVGAYLVWMVWDGVRRTEDSDKVEGYLLANRSLPWWAVGLSVMATQLSAITLVGATGQGYADGMRFVQFYFGLPIAMIILCVTLVPFFYRARVYTAYEYLERRFDLKTRTLASVLFLLLARAVVRRDHRGARGDSLDHPRLEPDADHPRHRPAHGALHDGRRRAGGHLDRRQADGGHRRRPARGRHRARPRTAGRRQRWRRAARGRRRRAADGGRLPLRLDADLHVLVGPARRAVPDAVVLRLRSEPGAALPDGEVGRGGTRLADDERVRQDSAAGAGAADRRARLRLLPVQAAADAVQPGARGEGREERAGGGVPSAREPSSPRRSRRGAPRRRRSPRPTTTARSQQARAAFDATNREVSALRARAAAARPRGHRRREVQGSDRRHARSRRQLRLPDVRHDAAAARARRADHRRDLRRRDVAHCGGAQLAGDVERHRHLPAAS